MSKTNQEKLDEYINDLSLERPIKNLLSEMAEGNISENTARKDIDAFFSQIFTKIRELKKNK